MIEEPLDQKRHIEIKDDIFTTKENGSDNNNNECIKNNQIKESSGDKVILINHPIVDVNSSHDDIKVKENGNFSSDNCQVTISSNHSTIINSNEAAEEDKSNISIVTIKNGKNISIKSSDYKFKNGELNNIEYDKSNNNVPLGPTSNKKIIDQEKIVLNNEYVPQIDSNSNENIIESSKSEKSTKTSSTNDTNIKTTIKVNLNLVSERDLPTTTQKSSDNKLLTRIDQATSRNYERKREIASSQLCNDKENNHTIEQAVILRKKRETVFFELFFSQFNNIVYIFILLLFFNF